MGKGWKSYLGAVGKGIAGAVGSVLVATSGSLPMDHATAKEAGIAAALYFIGNALKEVGMAHKAERAIEATKENTEAVRGAA